MATGDLKNNLRILNSELKKLNVPSNVCNLVDLSAGNTDAFLGIFDNILQWHSPALSRLINSKGLKPPSKENKIKFLEGVYLILREIFNWKPPLTVAQFTSSGFHERKVIMCTEVIRLVSRKIQELEPKATKRQQTADLGGLSGLKLILKQPKKGVVNPLKEKGVNVKSVLQSCDAKGGHLKGGSCICKFSVSEKPASVMGSTSSGIFASDSKENIDPEQESDVNVRILSELVEFKAVVISRFENLESRVSAVEKKIDVIEHVLDGLKCANNVDAPHPPAEI